MLCVDGTKSTVRYVANALSCRVPRQRGPCEAMGGPGLSETRSVADRDRIKGSPAAAIGAVLETPPAGPASTGRRFRSRLCGPKSTVSKSQERCMREIGQRGREGRRLTAPHSERLSQHIPLWTVPSMGPPHHGAVTASLQLPFLPRT